MCTSIDSWDGVGWINPREQILTRLFRFEAMLLLSICFQVTFSILTLKFVMLIGAKNKFIRQKKKAVFFKQEETTQSNYSVMNVATTARQLLATVLFLSFFLYCSCRKQSENLLHGANTERV